MRLEEINEELKKLATQRSTTRKEIENLDNEIAQKENQIAELNNEKEKVNNDIVGFNSSIENINARKEQLEQEKASIEQRRAEIFVNTTIEEVRQRLQERENIINEKVNAIIEEARQTYVANRTTDYSEAYINELKEKAKSTDPIYQNNMELMNRNQAIDDEISKVIDQQNLCDQEIAKIQDSINSSNMKLKELDDKRKNIEDSINGIKQTQQEKANSIKEIDNTITDFFGRRVAATKIEKNQKEIEGLKFLLSRSEMQFNEVNRQFINQFRNKDSFGMSVGEISNSELVRENVVVPESEIKVSAGDYQGLQNRIQKLKDSITYYEKQNAWLEAITNNGANATVQTIEQKKFWKEVLIEYNKQVKKQPVTQEQVKEEIKSEEKTQDNTTVKTEIPQAINEDKAAEEKAKEEFVKKAYEAKERAEKIAKMTKEDIEYKAKRDSLIQAKLKEKGIDLAGKSFNDLTLEEKQTFKQIRDEVLAQLADEMNIDIEELKANGGKPRNTAEEKQPEQEIKTEPEVEVESKQDDEEKQEEQDEHTEQNEQTSKEDMSEYNAHIDILVADGRVRFIKGVENEQSRGEFYCIYNTATLQNLIMTECVRNNERILSVEELKALFSGKDSIAPEERPKNITELYEGTENLDLNIIASILQFDKAQGANKTVEELNKIIKRDISEYVKTVKENKENPNIEIAYDMRNKSKFINQLNQGKAADGYEEFENLKKIAKSAKNYAVVELTRLDKIKEGFASIGGFFKNIFKKKDVEMLNPGNDENSVNKKEEKQSEQNNENGEKTTRREKTAEEILEEEKEALKKEVIDQMKDDVKIDHDIDGAYSQKNYNENINEYLDKRIKNANSFDERINTDPLDPEK